MRSIIRTSLSVLFLLTAAGCVRPPADRPELPVSMSVQNLTAMQNRIFATADNGQVMRASITTLQEQGYRISAVDRLSGRIAATRGPETRTILLVVPEGSGATRVTADSYVRWSSRDQQVDSAEYYERDIFLPLSRRLGLPTQGGPMTAPTTPPAS